MKKVMTTIALAFALIGSATAQNISARSKQAPTTVAGGKTTINSNLKSRGFIGPYEIIAHRERGLFGPSTVETFVFDIRDGSLVVINPANSAGIGVAAVNGGAAVGASYLFGKSLKPDQTQITAGSTSASDSSSNASASGSGTSTSTGGGGNVHNNNNNNDHSHNH